MLYTTVWFYFNDENAAFRNVWQNMPESGGINKFPRNFLDDGNRVHQFLKSDNDMDFSETPWASFENTAELRNASNVLLFEPSPTSLLSANIVSWMDSKTDSKSDLAAHKRCKC